MCHAGIVVNPTMCLKTVVMVTTFYVANVMSMVIRPSIVVYFDGYDRGGHHHHYA
jgi:hypothetical protein